MLIHFYILFVITNHVSAKRTSYSYDNSILLNCFIVLKLQSFTLLTLITLQKEIEALLGHYRVTYKIDFYKSFDDNIWRINDYCGCNANLKWSAIFSKNSIFQKRSGPTNNVLQYMTIVLYEHSGGYISMQKKK